MKKRLSDIFCVFQISIPEIDLDFKALGQQEVGYVMYEIVHIFIISSYQIFNLQLLSTLATISRT